MSNLVLLVLCFGLGVFFKKTNRFPENTPQVLNAFVLNISLPALVLSHIHEIKVSSEILLPAIMPWIIFALAGILFYSLKVLKILNQRTAICLVLTAGLGNTSFVGIPLLETYLGKESLGFAIISDQLGTFLVLSFPGMMVASLAEGKNWEFTSLIKRVFSFTPVIALVFAILLRPFEYPDWFSKVLQRLGDTLSPLALVSVGFLLNLRTLKGHQKEIWIGLGFKLLFSPLFIYFLYKELTSNRLMFETIVLEAAMAPMITSTIVAIDRNIAPHLASLMLGLGIPISFISTYFFLYLMKAGII